MHALSVTVHLAAEKPPCEWMLRISHGAHHAICFDRHEHGTRIRAVMRAHRTYHVVHRHCLHHCSPLSSATLIIQKAPPSFISPSPPLSLAPSSSSRSRHIRHPEIPIRIEEIHFA